MKEKITGTRKRKFLCVVDFFVKFQGTQTNCFIVILRFFLRLSQLCCFCYYLFVKKNILSYSRHFSDKIQCAVKIRRKTWNCIGVQNVSCTSETVFVIFVFKGKSHSKFCFYCFWSFRCNIKGAMTVFSRFSFTLLLFIKSSMIAGSKSWFLSLSSIFPIRHRQCLSLFLCKGKCLLRQTVSGYFYLVFSVFVVIYLIISSERW